MSDLHKGKIYLFSNPSWNNLKKIGVAKNTNERIKNMQTALPEDIQVLYESEELIDKFFYEYYISKILYKFRYRPDREFYEIETEYFIKIIEAINIINKLYDCKEKLKEFIRNFDNKYYQKRFFIKNVINKCDKKRSVKKQLFVCTL